jgi:hypothetical protein
LEHRGAERGSIFIGAEEPGRVTRRTAAFAPTISPGTIDQKEALKRAPGNKMNKQHFEWLQCVRDYSDGLKGYGGYVTAGPGLRPVDQWLRKLGYVIGAPNRAIGSVVTDAGRAALAAQEGAEQPSAVSAS